MDKIPDEILLIGVIVLVVKLFDMVSAILPYQLGDGCDYDPSDYDPTP